MIVSNDLEEMWKEAGVKNYILCVGHKWSLPLVNDGMKNALVLLGVKEADVPPKLFSFLCHVLAGIILLSCSLQCLILIGQQPAVFQPRSQHPDGVLWVLSDWLDIKRRQRVTSIQIKLSYIIFSHATWHCQIWIMVYAINRVDLILTTRKYDCKPIVGKKEAVLCLNIFLSSVI